MPEQITRIEDKRLRTIAYCKRKRIIIKKCIEIALKCDQDVYLCMYDKESGRMIELNTNDYFMPESILDIKKKTGKSGSQKNLVCLEKYTKRDYETFLRNSTIKDNQYKPSKSSPENSSSDNSNPKKM